MIINSTKKTVIAKDHKKATNFIDKTLGLVKKSNPRAMVFNTRFGIHTFFMNDAIDVLILDKDKHVVIMKQNLSPNKIYLWNPRFETVIELPSGTIMKTKTQVGDEISFI